MIPVRVTLSSISQLFAAKIFTINSAIKMTNAKKVWYSTNFVYLFVKDKFWPLIKALLLFFGSMLQNSNFLNHGLLEINPLLSHSYKALLPLAHNNALIKAYLQMKQTRTIYPKYFLI